MILLKIKGLEKILILLNILDIIQGSIYKIFYVRRNSIKNKYGIFVEVCGRQGLKVSAVKSKVMVLGGKDGSEFDVFMFGLQLENVS